MTPLSEKIIREYMVRKTGKQKKAFRDMLIGELNAQGVDAREEKGNDLFRSVNVVAGDPDNAHMIFGAHYDTCPRLPFPNFITPRNIWAFIAYQIGMVAVIVAVFVVLVALILKPLEAVSEIAAYIVWLICYFGLLALMMKGPANPKTYNDNTSGVVGLVELMAKMPADVRERCAFVFFDNEEVGVLGSAAFRKLHPACAKETPMVNLDCIGDGDHLMLSASKGFRGDAALYEALKAAFADKGSVMHVEAEKTIYPSDQAGFKVALAIAALKKMKVIGYYMDRIHTPKDTILREDNVERITDGLSETACKYLG